MKGSFGVSDIIIFFLFVLIVAAVFLVFNLATGEEEQAEAVQPRTEELVMLSYLRSPVSEDLGDIDGDNETEVETVADLIGIAYQDENARDELRAELRGTFQRVTEEETIEDVHTGLRYFIQIRYPNGDTITPQDYVESGMFSSQQTHTVQLPLPDAKSVQIVFGTRKPLTPASTGEADA